MLGRGSAVTLLLLCVLAWISLAAAAVSDADESKLPPSQSEKAASTQIPAAGDADRITEADRLAQEALELEKQGRQKEAIGRYQAAAGLYRPQKPESAALCLEAAGKACYELKDFGQALDLFTKAAADWRSSGNLANEARSLRRVAQMYRMIANTEQAQATAEKARAISRECGDRPGEVAACNLEAEFAYRRGDVSRAVAVLEEALPIARSTGDRKLEARVLGNMALIWNRAGDSKKALNSFLALLPIQRETGDRDGEASTLANLGMILETQGDYRQALAYDEQALAMFRELQDSKSVALVLNNLGTLLDSLGDRRESLARYREALEILRSGGDRFGEATSLNAIGSTLLDLDDVTGATGSYEQALEIYRSLRERSGEGSTLHNLGTLHARQGDYLRAVEFFEQAAKTYEEIHHQSKLALALDNLGEARTRLGESRSALACLTRAIAVRAAIGSRQGDANTLDHLMRAWVGAGNRGWAVFIGKKAVNEIQALRGNIAGLERERRQSFMKGQETTYRDLAEQLLFLRRPAEAQQVLELMKEEEQIAYLGGARLDVTSQPEPRMADLTPREQEADRLWTAALAELAPLIREEAALAIRKKRSDEEERRYQELVRDRPGRDAGLLALSEKLAAEFPLLPSDAEREFEPASSVELVNHLKRLGPGTAAVYVLVGKRHCWLLLITPAGRQVRSVAVEERELLGKIREFRGVLQNPERDPLPEARVMYQILVEPVEPLLRKEQIQTVLWALDREFRYLPVAALHDGKRYLAERFTLAILTPASRFSATAGVTRPRALAFGVTRAHGEFSALPGVAAELDAVVRRPGQAGPPGALPGEIRLDGEFTREALLEGARSGFSLLHVASHFQFRTGAEADSFLLLGDGSRLTLSELKRLEAVFAGVDLLVLSACSTAMGAEDAYGQEVEGFGVLAQRLGAQSVVASLWPVEDLSTARLMREFYRLLAGSPRMGKARALREAQLTMIKRKGSGPAGPGDASGRSGLQKKSAGPLYSHPYFWSSFTLIGSPR